MNMPPENPLSKRIKRHVIGRMHKFFAATSPGFGPVCLNELLCLPVGATEATVTAGGIEFDGRLVDCYVSNLNLRSANRILMRIQAFKSSNFRQLEKKLLDLPWELYLQPGDLPKIHVTAKHCRLHHTGAITQRFQTSISVRMGGITPCDEIQNVSSVPQNIWVRGVDDRFTVSIDSSGDILYKRGLKKHTAKAPLRETLAAAALLLAGYDGRGPLLDPMCGSGTFALEGALMAKRIPAGWSRNFAFMEWPSFRSKRWAYIRRQAESHFVEPDRPLIFASDTDLGACQKLERCVQKHRLSDAVQVNHRDFFDLDLREVTDRVGVICINPPYGRRLGGRTESEKFFHAICDKLKSEYQGWKLVLFAPSKKLAGTVPFQTKSYPVLHGGLKLALLIGKIQS
jgi:putative N6-adenine-specific DNA methylase